MRVVRRDLPGESDCVESGMDGNNRRRTGPRSHGDGIPPSREIHTLDSMPINPLMNTTPYWIESKNLPKSAALRRDLKVDVVVIGGGITGVTAAYLLKKSGATVALLERDRFASAETGHTTAHLTYVTDLRLQELIANFGSDHAQATWDAGQAAIEQIHEICETERIACDFRWVPGYLHAPAGKANEDESAALRNDAELARELGFEAAFLENAPFVNRPGIRFANQAIFNPRKYVAGLLKTIRGDDSHAFEQTNVDEIQEEPLGVKANGRVIHCKHVFIATHVPLQGAAGTLSAALFQTKLAPYSTYAVGAKVPQGAAPQSSFWDTGTPYFYLRIDRKKGFDYAILGGADHKTGQARDPERHYAKVEKRLRQLFPNAEIDHHWSGQVIESNDGLPFIGETAPHQFVATGFSGNGMTLGTVAAMMIRDAVNGRKNPWSQLFDVNRKKFLGGAWNYLKENKDYPYYLLKDLFTRPSANFPRSIKRGEGKIVLREGAKVAAYRDEHGKLTVKSAICPHLGCVVNWNGVEKTWDCPCHGSRFMATGEVIAGPAETPLQDVG
jgi:glycine/D-amino acid oxidase-like deaminating enzyme/nitrite reductase/ring-hydroxylating ferredoxin subunit